MTLCMAYTDGETTWIGADTVLQNGFGWRHPVVMQKWIPLHGWMVGIAGAALVRFAIDDAAKVISGGEEPIEIVAAIWQAHVARGMKPVIKEGEFPEHDSDLILARPGRVFRCNSFGDACEISVGRWCCIGQGDEVAYGALDALTAVSVAPLNAMRVTIDIAHRYFPSIDGFWAAELGAERAPKVTH